MASVAGICNLALAHFGQDAGVISISPPDDSIEAQQCAIYYPIALDQILESYAWSFATKRATLAELTNDRTDFAYRYALPNDCLLPQAVLPYGYTSTSESEVFQREDQSIYTDVDLATLVYTYRMTSTGLFSGQFTVALSWLLASYVCGPITKDATGRTQSLLYQRYTAELGKAAASNANSDTRRATLVSTAAKAR